MSQALELRKRLLLPIALGILAAAGAVVAGYYLLAQHDLDEAFERKVEQGQVALHAMLDERGKRLALSADAVLNDRQLMADMLARDRHALLQHIKPLFDHLRAAQQITHLYIYNNDQTVFLRAHQPEAYDDLITRATLSSAVNMRQTAIGVELGTLGDLTLRTVTPWFDGKNVIGYVEIGQEISPLIGELKRVFGLDAFAAINKNLITRANFDTGRQILGRENRWNSDGSVVVIHQTMPSTPSVVTQALETGKVTTPRISLTAANGKHHFHLGLIPIEDASAELVGHVALLEDVTRGVTDIVNHVRVVGMTAGALALLLIVALSNVVRRAERSIAQALDEQQAEQNKKDRARLKTIEDLEANALYDRVSTLPNRVLFLDRIAHQINAAQREKQTFAVVIVEITNHKALIDTLGERLLDQLLQQIAFRLKEGLRKSDTTARYTEDQFAAVLPAVSLEIAVSVAQKLVNLFSNSFAVENVTVEVRATQGWALFPYHGQDIDTLLRRADTARRSAAQHHNEFEVYDSRKESAREQQLQLLAGLQRAIAHDELQLHYFPRVDMRSRKINGVEALLRWRHSEQGSIPPDELIPMAENTGLIRQLTAWVANRALRQQAQWRNAGMDLSLSINLSSVNLLDGNFAAQLRQLFAKWGTQPNTVSFEISERTLTSSPKKIGDAIKQLHALGCPVAIDDVGAGNSSMPYLKTLPVAEIKLDTSIIYTLPDNQNNVSFVRSAIQLAHGLGIGVVAEGVKNKAIWEMLDSLGCDMAQGYHICQPITSGAFECWLVNSKYGMDKRGLVCAVRIESE